eukprot:4973265-Prorocentrum_lima.AAC.1
MACPKIQSCVLPPIMLVLFLLHDVQNAPPLHGDLVLIVQRGRAEGDDLGLSVGPATIMLSV